MNNLKKVLIGAVLVAGLVVPQFSFAQSMSDNVGGSGGGSMPLYATVNSNAAGNTGNSPSNPLTNMAFCYDFRNNISATGAMDSSDIVALNKILAKENLSGLAGLAGLLPSTATASFSVDAVKNFQAKYAADVLAPQGLSAPTGYVGAGTRAKLNALYGCARNVSPKPIMPDPIYPIPTKTTPDRTTTVKPIPSTTVPPKTDPAAPKAPGNRTEVKVSSPKAGDTWVSGNTYTINFEYDVKKADAKYVIAYLVRNYPDSAIKEQKVVRINWSQTLGVFQGKSIKSMDYDLSDAVVRSGGEGSGYRVIIMICSADHSPCSPRGASGLFSLKFGAHPDVPTATVDATVVANTIPVTATFDSSNTTAADVTGNGIVNSADLEAAAADLGTCPANAICAGDVDHNNVVNFADLGVIAKSVEVINLGAQQ